MLIDVKVKCPYCGIVNEMKKDIHEPYSTWFTVHCDTEVNGCDKPFNVELWLEAETRIYTLTEAKKKRGVTK